MRKQYRKNKAAALLCLIALLICMLTACGTSGDGTGDSSTSSDYKTESNTELSDMDNAVNPSENNNLSGIVPGIRQMISLSSPHPARMILLTVPLSHRSWLWQMIRTVFSTLPKRKLMETCPS